MSQPVPGSPDRPLRVAVVGAGPAGFYTVEALLKREGLAVDVDLLERLPAPFGLLRYGVAPDHQKIKSIAAGYERVATDPRVRWLGNVPVGAEAVGVDELAACYDQVVYSTGCETGRRLAVPGEDLLGCHSATSFVAWYNGHPDHRDLQVDLGTTRAVIVGIGDVAMDLARILLRHPDELAPTDIADHALDRLRHSRIEEVVILARRGPGQAAFAPKELEDIAELDGVDVSVDADPVRGAQMGADVRSGSDRKKLDLLAALAARERSPHGRRLVIRFLASPVEVLGEDGRVAGVRIELNRLVRTPAGDIVARGSGRYETIPAGLVLGSVGYRGVALPGLPFDGERGVVPNVDGRVLAGGRIVPRTYVAGWFKRGATGVVGTNKADAAATVARMVEDIPSLDARDGAAVSRAAFDALLAGRGVRVVDWEGWKRIDRLEVERGAARGSIRAKFTSVDEMLAAAGA